jgi:hypothetical protein
MALRWLHVSVSVCAALVLPAFASAQATFTSQERSVETTSHRDVWLWEQGTNPVDPDFDPPAAGYPVDHSNEVQAPDFGSFTGTALSTTPPVVGISAPVSTASASQTSSLAPGEIAASGSFATTAHSFWISGPAITDINALLQPPIPYWVGGAGGMETAVTRFSVGFQLSAATAFHLVGSTTLSSGDIGMGLPYHKSGSASIELSGPSGSVADLTTDYGCGCTRDLDSRGMLAPGSYTLSVSVNGYSDARCDLPQYACAVPSMSGSFDLGLTLAAPVVPGFSPPGAALLALALFASGAAALRRA